MNIYWLNTQRPSIEEFAWFSCIGTWGVPQVCSHCNSYLGTNLEPPFIVDIERGSVNLGDFSDAGATFLINNRAAQVLSGLSTDIAFHTPQIKSSKYKTNVLKVTDALNLVVPINNLFVHLDVIASNLEESESSCPKHKAYRFKTKELVFLSAALGEATCFHIYEFGSSRAWFCTQKFVDAFLAADITNIRFEHVGIAY
jgi:hypothetical protein